MADFEFEVLFDRKRYEEVLHEKLSEFIVGSADITTDWIALYAPVDTGALQESFYNEVSVRDYSYHIKSDLPYAWKQNEYYGYVDEGLRDSRDEIAELFKKIMG